MANQAPVNQILAVIDGNAGEIFEGRSNQVVIVAYATDARVGSHAGDDGLIEAGQRRLRTYRSRERAKEKRQTDRWSGFSRPRFHRCPALPDGRATGINKQRRMKRPLYITSTSNHSH